MTDDRDRVREAAERAASNWLGEHMEGMYAYLEGMYAYLRDLGFSAFVTGFLRGHAEGRAEREDEVRELLVELRDHIVPPRTLRDEDLIRRIAAALKETTP